MSEIQFLFMKMSINNENVYLRVHVLFNINIESLAQSMYAIDNYQLVIEPLRQVVVDETNCEKSQVGLSIVFGRCIDNRFHCPHVMYQCAKRFVSSVNLSIVNGTVLKQ